MLHCLSSLSDAFTVVAHFVSVASLDPKSTDAVHLQNVCLYSTPLPTAWKLTQFDLNPLLSAEVVFIYHRVSSCFSSWQEEEAPCGPCFSKDCVYQCV